MSNRIAAPTFASHADLDAPVGHAPNFSEVLRERTASVHREAERTGFIADLIRGRATRAGYALFLRNFIPVYEALEGALDLTCVEADRDGILAPFADQGLRRLDALRADLRTMVGPSWRSDLAVVPATSLYVRAIQSAAQDERLVAHAYARYLGDLSGGQILKPVLARTLGLTADALSFCDFPKMPDLAAPKTAMRAALDKVETSSPMADAIVLEAIAAFRHNIALSIAVQVAAG